MRILVIIITGLFLLSGSAFAQEWQSAEYLQARLLGAGQQDEAVMAALDIRLAEDWHSYWRTPGDAGLPPRLDWEGSENLSSAEIIWPVPQRYEIMGLYSFGYKDALVLPLEIKPAEKGKAVKLKLHAEIMVCKDICVPQTVNLALEIPPAGRAVDSPNWPRIQRALENVPEQENMPALKIESAVLGPDAIVVTAYSQNGYDKADLFVEAGDLFVTARPEITLDEKDPRKAMIRVAAPEDVENLAQEVMGGKVRLTFVNGRDAIERIIEF